VTTVGVQRANGKLVAQQVEFAGRKIEQRTDTRIGLLIVVAKMAFIISANLCDSPVRQQSPVIEKAAVDLDLKGSVLMDVVRKAVGYTVRPLITCQRIWI